MQFYGTVETTHLLLFFLLDLNVKDKRKYSITKLQVGLAVKTINIPVERLGIAQL